MKPQTLFEKIWDRHVVHSEPGGPDMLYIDFQLVHEVTSPQAFQGLREKGLKVRRPLQTLATIDHSIPTTDPDQPIADAQAAKQIEQLERNCQEFGVPLHADRRGVVHVIGPELGFTQPGMTIVCGDSHTATHGAFGALAFGIGTSEVEHVLATQTLLQTKTKTMRVEINGSLNKGVSAKDIILALISRIGVGGATGHVLEYAGDTISGLDMESRMTVCNMSIEAGARAGMIAPDDTTFQYLADKPFAPKEKEWEKALLDWRRLPSDPDAVFDRQVTIPSVELAPMITFGTNPGMAIAIDGLIPDPADRGSAEEKQSLTKALAYMGLKPKEKLLGHPIDVVFIGSCTNGRLSDLRSAAQVMKGRRLAPGVRALIVPGSQAIKRQAEAEGLDRIFLQAGAEWRESGCSMCIAMNGDQLQPGQYCVSTSNRNFEGRQGKGGRTLLASPWTAAAAAVTGAVTDVRTLL